MTQLLQLYQWLIGGVLLGWILRLILPSFVPVWIGRFLFWVGVPVGIFAFLRQADLSGGIWLAPVVAWIAILSGACLAWVWISRKRHDSPLNRSWSRPTQGSFILSSMVGNTGYIGFPIILSLVGTEYFGWAVFYDGLGSAIGAYGLGVLLAAKFGLETQNPLSLMIVMLKNPALWSLGFSLVFREVPFPSGVEQSLRVMAWSMIALSLILMGMRLSQLSSWRYLKQASVSLTIKMFIVPLVIGTILSILGVRGSPLLVMVLLMATPPAFATLVLAEAFNLDRELTVTTLAVGSVVLLMTLPFWLFLFGSS